MPEERWHGCSMTTTSIEVPWRLDPADTSQEPQGSNPVSTLESIRRAGRPRQHHVELWLQRHEPARPAVCLRDLALLQGPGGPLHVEVKDVLAAGRAARERIGGAVQIDARGGVPDGGRSVDLCRRVGQRGSTARIALPSYGVGPLHANIALTAARDPIKSAAVSARRFAMTAPSSTSQ